MNSQQSADQDIAAAQSAKRNLDASVKEERDTKKSKIDHTIESGVHAASTNQEFQELKRPLMSKAREIRLEQNRKAARESRRRKKVMIEELQRSVIFFSRANGTLKQQNDELSRLLMQAQTQIAAIENGQDASKPQQSQQDAQSSNGERSPAPAPTQYPNMAQQVQAQAVATQAMYESQGFPPAAARAAAQTMNASSEAPAPSHPAGPPSSQLPPMQPGATMQAMANFQQAAAAAMQAAMGMNPAAAAAAQGGGAHMVMQPTFVAVPPHQIPAQGFMQVPMYSVAPPPQAAAPN